MSGGVAFVAQAEEGRDALATLALGPTPCQASLCSADDPDVEHLRDLLERYAEATGSRRAAELLCDWPSAVAGFVKIALAPAVAEPAQPELAVVARAS